MKLSDSLLPRPTGPPPIDGRKGNWFRRVLFAALVAAVGLLFRRSRKD